MKQSVSLLLLLLLEFSLSAQSLSVSSRSFLRPRVQPPNHVQPPSTRRSLRSKTAVPSSYLFGSPTGMSDSDDKPRGRKTDQFQALVKRYWDRLSGASLIPSCVAFAVGYRVAVTRFLKQHAAASLEPTTAAIATQRPRPPIVMWSTLILLVSREMWRNIPTWLKRQIPFVRRKKTKRSAVIIDDDASDGNAFDYDENDLTSIFTIQKKLSSVFAVIEEKLGGAAKDKDFAFLALFKLTSLLKKKSPELRDERYKASGEVLADPKTVLKGMDEAFEYADWAYDELPDEKTLKEALEEKGYVLIRHDKLSLPGSVSHYIAMNRETKQILVGVKGTSSAEDMLTDLCGQAVTHQLTGPFIPDTDNSPTEIRCHEGVILAARRLADDLAPLVEDLFLPSGYKLLITGHSLGAGVAALCGLLLRSRFPENFVMDGHDKDDSLKVLAFASPPVLDYDAALACQSFCTTIINNSDIIPRASVSNLIVTFELVRVVRERLNDLGLDPKDWNSTKAFLQMLTGKTIQIMNGEDFEEELDKAQSKVQLRDPDHLYCPGKVLHLFDLWSKKDYGEKVVKDEDGLVSEEVPDTTIAVVRTAESLIATNGTSKVLRWIETDDRMLGDHLSPAYRSSLKALLCPEVGTNNSLSSQ
jgi:hypothetical protein